ncbi:hypothetical protein QQ056_12890 [Oscillatoria laete-virens NRMC-F 0139]|nr:hypothetical protein [Oscillatoria laete-virens]MDL5054435.1 hypothetical protein [Oscillatoria laete-virens NRMC-F 0139]
MSKQMIISIVLAVFLVALIWFVVLSTRNMSRATDTSIVFAQLKNLHERQSLVSTNGLAIVEDWVPLPQDKKDELLAQLARAQGIDWGRSRAADGRIFDAWGTPVDVDYQFCGYHVMLRFRSAGPDKKLRTHDDVF